MTTASLTLHDLARNARRAWDESVPGFYLTSRFTGLPLRGPYLSWSEANLALSYAWPVLTRLEHEVVEL